MSDSALRPVVAIKLGKQTRHLLVNFRAMILLEEQTGKSILAGGVWENLSAKEVKIMAWGALLWADEKLTLNQVGKWIHSRNFRMVMDKITEAWSKGLGVEDRAHEFRPLEIRPEMKKQAA